MFAPPSFDRNRLLKQTVKPILEPAGLYELAGRKTWIDDHGWWVIDATFASKRGWTTDLVVGVCFTWVPRTFLGYDYQAKSLWKTPMGRFEQQGFQARRPEWFERDARAFAEGAIAHIQSIRGMDITLRHVVAAFDGSTWAWGLFHRGVAAGLIGDHETARGAFDALLGLADPVPPEDLRANVKVLRQLLDSPHNYRSQVVEQIAQFRASVKLRDLSLDGIAQALDLP